jgi:hypothetical protein
MQLLTLETQFEELFIINHLNSTVPGFANHWMSATDFGVPNTWVWSGTGERMTYSNWAPGHPSGQNPPNNTETATHLGLYNSEIMWFDSNELVMRYTICEELCMTSCQIG